MYYDHFKVQSNAKLILQTSSGYKQVFKKHARPGPPPPAPIESAPFEFSSFGARGKQKKRKRHQRRPHRPSGGALQPHKQRKKNPYYGRRKRSPE